MVMKSSQNSIWPTQKCDLLQWSQSLAVSFHSSTATSVLFRSSAHCYLEHMRVDKFCKSQELKLNCSHSGDKTNVRCRFDATDRAATATSEKKNLLAELFPTMWKQTEATLRWCVGELARGRRREWEREREKELSLHSPLWMQHVFQLNIPLCPCSFSAAVYEPFSNTPISACQHWRTNRLRLQTHTHTHTHTHTSERHTAVHRWRKGE